MLRLLRSDDCLEDRRDPAFILEHPCRCMLFLQMKYGTCTCSYLYGVAKVQPHVVSIFQMDNVLESCLL